ncbi:MAG: 1-acyl-sn-glycerol-3-phosphate acyltransferase [Clostridia bacterium]|nr:1-acyl-sn-glycerol-3-phosphate acyltransferase [Clostridia bacterium]
MNDSDNSSVTAKKDVNINDKYPTKRGLYGIMGKNIFLLLTDLTTNIKAIGTENFPKTNPYVVASNHQSYADGVLICKYLPRGHFKYMCCLAASDLETSHGWLGRLIMRVGRGIAVDRYGNPVRGLIKAKKEVENGNICFVFPEGTRSATGKLGEMKDGASYLAIKSGTPLIPVYISGAYQIWPRQSKWPKPFKGFLKRKKLRIVIGEPLYSKDFDSDAHKMTAHLSQWMHDMEEKYWDPEVMDRELFSKK